MSKDEQYDNLFIEILIPIVDPSPRMRSCYISKGPKGSKGPMMMMMMIPESAKMPIPKQDFEERTDKQGMDFGSLGIRVLEDDFPELPAKLTRKKGPIRVTMLTFRTSNVGDINEAEAVGISEHLDELGSFISKDKLSDIHKQALKAKTKDIKSKEYNGPSFKVSEGDSDNPFVTSKESSSSECENAMVIE